MAAPLNLSGLTDVANSQARNMYYMALANGSDANTALQRAMFEWQKTMDTAQMTGKWNGQWSNPQEQWFTGQFGQWFGEGGGPTAGQQTLEAEQQKFNQALGLSGMYGQYYAPGTTPEQGAVTQDARNQAIQNAIAQAGVTGTYYNTAPTQQQYLQARASQLNTLTGMSQEQAQQTALAEWNQGRAQGGNVAGGMPAGMEYGGQQTQQAQQQQWAQSMAERQFAETQRQNAQQNAQNYLQLLSSLRGPADWAKYQQVLGSTPGGMRDLYAAAMGQYVPGGGATTGVQPQAASLQSMMNQVGGQPQNEQVWGSGIGIGQQQPTSEQQMQGYGGGTNLPAPNQMSAQSWNNLQPSQQQLLLGSWEAQGYDKNDALNLYKQSLPRYGSSNQATAGTWRM